MLCFRETIQSLTNKIVTSFYRRLIVVTRSLDGLSDPRPHPSTALRRLTEDDVDAYCVFHPGCSAEEFQARVARGDQCFAVMCDGRIAHACWASTRRTYVPYLRRDLIPSAGDIFQYDSYTHPDYRRCGLGSLRLFHVSNRYRAAGFLRSVALVTPENEPAIRAVTSFGYTPIGLLSCLRLGPWQWNWQKACPGAQLPAIVRCGAPSRRDRH